MLRRAFHKVVGWLSPGSELFNRYLDNPTAPLCIRHKGGERPIQAVIGTSTFHLTAKEAVWWADEAERRLHGSPMLFEHSLPQLILALRKAVQESSARPGWMREMRSDYVTLVDGTRRRGPVMQRQRTDGSLEYRRMTPEDGALAQTDAVVRPDS